MSDGASDLPHVMPWTLLESFEAGRERYVRMASGVIEDYCWGDVADSGCVFCNMPGVREDRDCGGMNDE